MAVLVLLARAVSGRDRDIPGGAGRTLRIGISHAASSQAFYLAESGLATWFASARSALGGGVRDWEAKPSPFAPPCCIRVDSVTVLVYRVSARATVGSGHAGDSGVASREISLLGESGAVRSCRSRSTARGVKIF